MFGLGTTEIALILFVLLLLFGGKKLPELSRSIGKSIKELRTAMNEKSEKKK